MKFMYLSSFKGKCQRKLEINLKNVNQQAIYCLLLFLYNCLERKKEYATMIPTCRQ